jgi:hypothetical protein
MIEAEFNLHESVAIQVGDKQVDGRICAIWVTATGNQFRVRYLDKNGVIQDDWFEVADLASRGE